MHFTMFTVQSLFILRSFYLSLLHDYYHYYSHPDSCSFVISSFSTCLLFLFFFCLYFIALHSYYRSYHCCVFHSFCFSLLHDHHCHHSYSNSDSHSFVIALCNACTLFFVPFFAFTTFHSYSYSSSYYCSIHCCIMQTKTEEQFITNIALAMH